MKENKSSKKESKNKGKDMKKCFIIMPITTPESWIDKYSEDKDHFKHVLDNLFIPAIEKSKLQPIPPIVTGADIIHGKIIKNLETADLVFCDMSTLNPNVFFELGIRSSLNKPVSLVKDDVTQKIPFDTTIINHHTYRSALRHWEIQEDINSLSLHINNSIKTSEGKNSLWKYFGFSSTARPAEEKEGVEAKLDYLIMVVDSLREGYERGRREFKEELYEPKIDISQFEESLRSVAEKFGAKMPMIIRYPNNRLNLRILKGSLKEDIKDYLESFAILFGYNLKITEI